MDTSHLDIECDVRMLTTGVAEVTIRQGRAASLEVASRLSAKRIGYLVANFRRANVPLPSDVLPEADCFSNAPTEIRDSESLHVVALDFSQVKAPPLEGFADADAGMIIFSDHDTESLMVGQQILWAWFARPSLLVNQLSVGTADLAMRLLEFPQVVLIEAPPDTLVLFTLEANAAEVVSTVTNRHAGSL